MKVSVIVPVHNVENYLSECLDSILSQSFTDLEVICIDDGSTDNSLGIIKSYSKKDSRIKIISQTNHGPGHARNTGLKNTSGDYILFIDSDDFIFPDSIKLLYENAVKNNSDFVAFMYTRDLSKMDAPGFNFKKDFKNDIDFTNITFDYKQIRSQVLNGFTNVWIQFFKKEFLDKYDDFIFQENLVYEDVLFHVKSFIRAERISYLPKICYYYRKTPYSIMDSTQYSSDIFPVIKSVYDFLAENNLENEFKDEFDYFNIYHTLHYLISTNTEDYFQKTKREFSKISLSENHIVDKNSLKLYEMVLKCDTFAEFLKEYYAAEDKNRSSQGQLTEDNKNMEFNVSQQSQKIEKLKKKVKLYKSRIAVQIKNLF